MQRRQNTNPGVRRLAVWVLSGSTLAWGWDVPRRAWPSASSATLEEVVRQVESSYRGVKTLRAEFTQTYVWGERKREESGTVYFARGGLMRWEYEHPAKKLFLSDGKKLYLYVPAERQLTSSSLKSSEDLRVLFRLMLSRLSLRRVFSKIEFADREPKRAPEDLLLRGFPRKGHEEDYQQALLELSPQFDLRRLVVVATDHSIMEFTFDHIERNVALNPSLFRFTPPPGTEVF